MIAVIGLSCNREVARDPRLDKPDIFNKTIGSLASVYQNQTIAVKGYGLVAGLAGTGSGECPPALREALTAYIRKQIPRTSKVNPNELINSKDTAVVEIYGILPVLAGKGDTFDVMVRALPQTQTISLRGGRLYTAEMKELSRFIRYDQYLNSLAQAQGQLVSDDHGDGAGGENTGYILGGGTVDKGVTISLALKEPNYFTANAIRNQLIERFGPGTAKAVNPGEVELTIPQAFRNRRDKFIRLAEMTYMASGDTSQQQRIGSLLQELREGKDKAYAELGLEAIGRPALFALGDLLKSGPSDESVRFHAARCMLNIGDDRGLDVLQAIAMDSKSPLRFEVIEAVGQAAKRNDASRILGRLLDDDAFEVKLAAYEQLVRLGDMRISRKLIGGEFFVDTVKCSGPKIIYISRKNYPQITLFGGDIPCETNIYVETPTRRLTVNARAGDPYVSLIRTHPSFPRPIGPVRAKYDVQDIIRTACERMDVTNKPSMRPGLEATYSDVVSLLDRMCHAGAIRAEFRMGPMTEAKQLQPAIGTSDEEPNK